MSHLDRSTIEKNLKQMEEIFGSREQHMLFAIDFVRVHKTPCDITFYDREPMLDVVFESIMPRNTRQAIFNVPLTDGRKIDLPMVWTIMPMDPDFLTIERLAQADMSLGDSPAGPDGLTVREMIRNSYRCKSEAELEWFVRRFAAS